MSNKLVRLTTTETDGLFDAQFNDPLYIKPMSSIGLQSANINIFQPNLTITGGFNNTFTVRQNDHTFVAALIEKDYNNTNYLDLLRDIADEANLGLKCDNNSADPNAIGIQVNVRVGKQGKVIIEMLQGVVTAPVTDAGFISVRFKRHGLSLTDATVKKDGALAASNDLHASYFQSLGQFNKASGLFNCRIKHMTSGGGVAIGGFVFGLVHKSKIHKLHGQNANFVETDFTIAIQTGNNVGDNYRILQGQNNTGFVDSGVAPERLSGIDFPDLTQHDRVQIRVTQGVAVIEVKQHTAGTTILGQPIVINVANNDNILGDNLQTEFYGVCCIRGALADCQLDSLRFREDPYANAVDLAGVDGITHATTGNFLGVVKNVIFPTTDLPAFLGFDNIDLNPTAGPFNDRFVADNTFEVLIKHERFILELLNLNIDSYDGFLKRRVNVLHSLQLEQAQTGSAYSIIRYEPNEIIYLDLNNAQELRLTNLRARIVSEQYKPIETEGFNVLNLLFK